MPGCDVPDGFLQKSMARLSAIADAQHENFVKVTHWTDTDFISGNVSLTESMGAREVASREAMAGKPTGGTGS